MTTLSSSAAVQTPAHRLVKPPALLVSGERPQHRLPVAIRRKVAEHDRHQRFLDAGAPTGRDNGNRVEFAKLQVYRVSAWSNANEPDNRALQFSNPPTMRRRLDKVASPPLNKLRRHAPLRHQFAEPEVPGIDIDVRYVQRIFAVGRPNLKLSPNVQLRLHLTLSIRTILV